MPSVEELKEQLRIAQEEEAEQARRIKHQTIANSVPAGAASADEYAPTAWGATEYDFVTPMGQRCRLRNVPLEEVAKLGILDQITRLPGLTEEVVRKAEGQPPEQVEMPSAETISAVVQVCDKLLPLVVVKPEVWSVPDPEAEDPADRERVNGRIYVDSIDIQDRIAIMNRTIGGVKALDKFRNG